MRGTEVLLPESVLCEMEGEAARSAPDESGGVLLGYEGRDDPKALTVLLQIGPGPEAVHEPYRFEPDGAWQEGEIATAYEESGRIATYLGDWHSHPGGSSRPSGLDRATARKIARSSGARCPHPLMVILAGGQPQWGIAAHRFGRLRLRPIRLRVVSG